jgi:hypothetical protein
MASSRSVALGFAMLCLALTPKSTYGDSPRAASDADVLALAERIDQMIASRWAEQGARPTHQADDAEFLRRVSLDLTGRIPNVWDLRKFLDDTSADKRLKVVRKLLEHPRYVEHFTTVWRAQMLPQTDDRDAVFLFRSLEPWLQKHFRANTPYDRMVRDLLTAKIATRRDSPPFDRNNPSPAGFYQANESKAENLAAATSRLFLGLKLECAQCHDHPFAKWSKKQFWEYAAFFSGVRPQEPRFGIGSPILDDPARRVIKVAGTGKEIEARFLDGSAPAWKAGVSTRTTLADWMTSPDNPYFARNAGNRIWAHFFGIGIVEPVDEAGSQNPPSHPELLDELARQFVAHQYDLKFLMRAITASRTYQLTSAATHPSQEEPRLFARMAVKGLTAEQLFDSLAVATGYQEGRESIQPQRFISARTEFLTKFHNPSEKRTEFQTSILQALSLMNGKLMAEVTNAVESRNPNQTLTILAVQDAPFLDTTQKRVEALYLAVLSRKPRTEELDRFVKYVDGGGASKDANKALADVFWALLNSSEFILNH